MSYTKDPFKNNPFRTKDGKLDFKDFWPWKRDQRKQEELDPEEASNAELAKSLATIVENMGKPDKEQPTREPKGVKVIRRTPQSYLSAYDKSASVILNNYVIDLKNFLLNPQRVQSYNWEDVVHSSINSRDINERLQRGVISDYLSRRGLGVLGSYSLFLEKGLLRIQDKKLGTKRLRLDKVFATHIQTQPRINRRDVDLTLMHFPNPSDNGKIMYQLHNPETKDILKAGLFYRSGNSFRIYEVLT